MKCKLCNMEMFIDHAGYEISGDSSADTRTVVCHVPYYICKNPSCSGKGTICRGQDTVIAEKEVGV